MRSPKLTLAAFAATVLLGAGSAQAEPVKIRMAWVAPVSNWASIILEKKDLAKHIGKSYTVETVRFAGTPQMITAIANGELEISNLAYSTLPLAIQNANLDDLRAAQMMNCETPSASLVVNSGREIFFISGLSENGSTFGIRATFFSASMARMVGNGASTMV